MALHSAPSVLYPLGRLRFLGCLLFAGWLIAAGVAVCWLRDSTAADWRPLLGLAALLVAAWGMAIGWRLAPVGQLQWDDQRWRWQSLIYRNGAGLELPDVVLGVQFSLLLRLDNQAGMVWRLWAERSASPARWFDLRRDVYTQQRPATLQISEGADPNLGELTDTVEHIHSAPARHL